MALSLKKFFIGGNWKCNNIFAETKNLVENVINKLEFDDNRVEVIVAPMFLHLPYVVQSITNKVQAAAQDCSATTLGAYTGEIAPSQIQDIVVHWVIIGHSERRTKYGETNSIVAKKLRNALDSNLGIVLCVGETLEQRESEKTLDIIAAQLHVLKEVIKHDDEYKNIVIAYEPVWAIGTGKTASPDQAEDVHKYIREHLTTGNNKDIADNMRIIYGGSVTDQNAEELMKKPNIDGFLVGGASLKPGFAKIVESCKVKL